MRSFILAIDPGTEQSGVVMFDRENPDDPIWHKAVMDNDDLIKYILSYGDRIEHLAIEQIRSYGMAIGASTLDTVEWSGRFIQCFIYATHYDDNIMRLPRLEIKVHLCGTAKAKDANIRQALIDRLGHPGTKKNPGPTYGISSHMWSALAVAVVAADKVSGKERGQA